MSTFAKNNLAGWQPAAYNTPFGNAADAGEPDDIGERVARAAREGAELVASSNKPERYTDRAADIDVAAAIDPTSDDMARLCRALKVDLLSALHLAGSGHPGGSLGMTDVFATLWFGGHMDVRPSDPNWNGRDRFVLSNGHICPILYAILARRGYFPRDVLWTLRKLGSPLQGHPDFHFTPGVDACTGSLGNGVSYALGTALGLKVQGLDARVYVGTSDGEAQEGQMWEMASAATHHGVDNLTLMMDRNGIQIDGYTKDVMDQGDLAEKYAAFGWHVEDVDGHDRAAIDAALERAKAVEGRPQILICHTVLGKGVSFMENQPGWHGNSPGDDDLVRAIAELDG